ncbi:hypothetical protein [Corynebacterium epidermidicanis]|uniref:Uncharacterized protein n=1 Tax=Corynebacterium epidermidicanis TaxID=1050174 RepID=A0A0G3GLF9_9CORY|nr:hypothetical protein [Corynebacterium epidermidicanis]AKK01999.1 hypothetical protein CEPID_00525 [Corynebacterium epidermidicanis]
MRLIAPMIAVALALSATPAHAQLPGGMNLQSIAGETISVPAGQTTTVDLGYPVQANYSGGGWSVSSSGTSVTVTAPASGSASVPVTVAGQSASINLVAEQGAEVPTALNDVAPPAAPAAPTASSDSPEAPDAPASGSAKSPASGGAAPTDVDRSEAEQIALDATIEGNRIVAKLGLMQAVNLQSKFGGTSTDGVKLRYLNVDGQEIKGVKREINKEARTLTLTYPEGTTPDNPFVMEAVRDGKSIAVVTLTDPNVAAAKPVDPAKSPVQEPTVDSFSDSKKIGIYALAGVGILVVLAVLAGLFARGRRK